MVIRYFSRVSRIFLSESDENPQGIKRKPLNERIFFEMYIEYVIENVPIYNTYIKSMFPIL